jgi:hypothetical protein
VRAVLVVRALRGVRPERGVHQCVRETVGDTFQRRYLLEEDVFFFAKPSENLRRLGGFFQEERHARRRKNAPAHLGHALVPSPTASDPNASSKSARSEHRSANASAKGNATDFKNASRAETTYE